MDAASFPVGHKVVCIHDHFPPAVHEWFNGTPVEGQIYTIHEVFWASEHLTRRPTLSVRLVELPPIRPGFGGFSLWRFRLLEDEKLLRSRSQKKDLPERVLT